jgi:ATP-dependent helicase/nuclease subunit B
MSIRECARGTMELRTLDWLQALAALDDGITLVTGNARLTRRALADHALRQHQAGRAIWRRADVLPWGAWLARMHEAALARDLIGSGEPSVLLSSVQVDVLWRQVIERDPADHGLLQPAAAARQAREARELCLGWQIDPERLRRANAGHEDGAAFLRWSANFSKKLAAGGWLEPAALADLVGRWLEQTPSLRPVGVYLAGFEEFTPQQLTLLNRLLDWGVDVARVQSGVGMRQRAQRTGCADAEQEMRAAAQWARARLDANPTERIGIVVRDLQDRRNAIMRELDTALHPSTCRQPGHRGARVWNLSLGVPLADEPLVDDALRWLALAWGNVSFANVGRLLRSPFFAGAEDERQGRLDLQVRLSLPTRQSPGAWAMHVARGLAEAGWPGERPLDSHEFQVLRAWDGLLQELTGLGTVQPAMTREEALSALRQLAQERSFQPQVAPASAPLQVLGLFEALGQQFDALWIMGLHDGVWPEPPRPNPFLPVGLQRELALPRASAARELAFAERLTAELLAAAPEVVVSWPQRRGDEPLRPSPLILSLPETPLLNELDSDAWRRMLKQGRLETLLDTQAPALADGAVLRGGTTLFKDQSNCPFRAFAIHRLRAKHLDSPEDGLDARTRGTLVHDILHGIWQHLKSRQRLAALTDAERTRLIAEHVAAAVAAVAGEQPLVFTARFAEVERRRLEALVDEWLRHDLDRPDFTVQECEHKIKIPIGGIRVEGILDRLDRLADGRLVLIDYKTGDTKPRDWLGDRPRDPQIPVYSLHFGPELGGVVVGRVRRYGCTWGGVVVDTEQFPGSQSPEDPKTADGLDWEGLRARWAAVAEGLARGFQAGDARVDPLPGACDYCHLTGLCRVHEIGMSQAMDEEE